MSTSPSTGCWSARWSRPASDQWGNIVAGVDFIRRKGAGPVHAFTTPLVTEADGKKFGKTEGGAIWLDPTMTAPGDFLQFWLNAVDRDVVKYLKYYSFRSPDEIEELAAQTLSVPESRAAQKALAAELTTLVHGQNAYDEALASG